MIMIFALPCYYHRYIALLNDRNATNDQTVNKYIYLINRTFDTLYKDIKLKIIID